MVKEETSWIWLMMKTILWSCLIPKTIPGYNTLVTPICFVLASRAIINHVPIGEYHLRFFPNEDFSCSCGNYSIKSRRHILHKCQRFNKYWNLRRDSIGHFISFLIFNSSAFMFSDSST